MMNNKDRNMRETSSTNAQLGIAMLSALIFLTILTIAGITAARMATLEERMASNAQFQGQAFQVTLSELETQVDEVNSGNREPEMNSARATCNAVMPTAIAFAGANPNSSMRYIGERPVENASLKDFSYYLFELNANTAMNSGATSNQSMGTRFMAGNFFFDVVNAPDCT